MNNSLCRSLLVTCLLGNTAGFCAESPHTPEPPRAAITRLDESVATLDAGAKVGLKAPMELRIYQGNVEAGRLLVSRVEADSAVGRVFAYVNKTVKPGDTVRLAAAPPLAGQTPTAAPPPAGQTPTAAPVDAAPASVETPADKTGAPSLVPAVETAPPAPVPAAPAVAPVEAAPPVPVAAPLAPSVAPHAVVSAAPAARQVAAEMPAPPPAAEGAVPGTVVQAPDAEGRGPYTMGASPVNPANPAPDAAAPPVAPVAAAPPAETPRTISNVFTDTDIREVLAEVASQAGVSIIVDESVKAQSISVEFNNDSVAKAIAKVALFGGLVWKEQSPNVFILSAGTPDSPLFRQFTVSRRYMPQNQTADTIANLVSSSYKPYVTTDKTTNIIGVTAPEELSDRILADIRAMDVPSRQFVVEALIAELTADNDKDFGFSWNWNQFGVDANLTLGYAKATNLDIARLKALITNGTATLRANPRISAFEGRQSTLNVGTETYFSILTGNANFPTSQIQVIRTGVTLALTGFIGDDGYITLSLSPEVGDFAASVGGNPTVTVRRATTNIRVKSGETIVIGGLIQDGSIKSTSKVPILGQIPLIGQLFTHTTTSKRRTDVVMMITPRLTEDGAGLAGSDGRLTGEMLQTSSPRTP